MYDDHEDGVRSGCMAWYRQDKSRVHVNETQLARCLSFMSSNILTENRPTFMSEVYLGKICMLHSVGGSGRRFWENFDLLIKHESAHRQEQSLSHFA